MLAVVGMVVAEHQIHVDRMYLAEVMAGKRLRDGRMDHRIVNIAVAVENRVEYTFGKSGLVTNDWLCQTVYHSVIITQSRKSL